RTERRQELQDEPVTENQHSGDRYQKNKDQGQDARARIEDGVRAHYAGNGAAGAKGGHRRIQVEDDVKQAGADSAEQIEEQVADVAVEVLDVIAKNPEKEHVASDNVEDFY